MIPDKVAEFIKRPGVAGHVAEAVRNYQFWWGLEANRAPPGQVREALRDVVATLNRAAELLNETARTGSVGTNGEPDTGLRQAWRLVEVAAMERGFTSPKQMGERVAHMLAEFAVAATLAAKYTATTRNRRSSAAYIGANSVRSILEHHNIRPSVYDAGLAVLLLLHVAREAGDRWLTVDAAKKAIQATGARSRARTPRKNRPNK